MFETSRRSLLTALLALVLLVTQGLALAQSTGTTHAAVVVGGPQIFLNPASSVRSAGNFALTSTYTTVTGTGFTPNTTVRITFNAPYSSDGSPLAPRSVPPAINRPGDDRVGPPAPAPGAVNPVDGGGAATNVGPLANTLSECVVTDANGNFLSGGTPTAAPVATACALNTTTPPPVGTAPLTATVGTAVMVAAVPGAGTQISIPGTAVDGIYEVTAVDTAGLKAATQYIVNREPTPDMTADPISGSSVPIEGYVKVHIRPGAFEPSSAIYFGLTNFDLGFGGSEFPRTPNAPAGQPIVQLPVVSCGTFSISPPDFAQGPSTYTDVCRAGANGGVDAIVQVQTLPPAAIFTGDLGPSDPILSDAYYDQVFAIVATGAPLTGLLPDFFPGATGFTSPSGQIFYTAGIHIDHGLPAITLSTNQAALGGAVVVNGTGFGAYVNVALYFVPLTGATALTGFGPGAPYFFSTPYSLGTTVTDSNGAFTTPVALNTRGLAGVSGQAGFILAEDFSGDYNASNWPIGPDPYGAPTTTSPNPFNGAPRLNEAATAAVTIIPPVGAPGTGLLISAQVAGSAGAPVLGTAANTATAAISSTVTVTATGFLPNEAVDVTIAGPSATTTILPFGAPYQPPVAPGGPSCPTQTIAVGAANQAGVAVISFLVPETCNTVTESTGGIANLGASVTVTASGEQSAISESGTLTIPPTTATIGPAPGQPTNPSNQGGTVILTGSGFAANEPVTFQFGQIDPFTGALTTPALTVSSQSDVAGNVTIPAVNIASSLTGGLYTLVARGLASGFIANVSTSFPFVYVNGNLNCPATTVLPGQPIVVTGSNFQPGTPVLVTLSPQGAPLTTIVSGIPGVLFNQTVINTPSGTFTVTPTVPVGTPAGKYILSFTGLVANATSGGYQQQLRECIITVGTAAPTVTVSPTSASIGQTVTVSGSGYGPNEPISVSLQYSDITGALTGTDVPGTAQVITTTATGTFSGSYTVASTVNALIAGAYNLTARGTLTGAIARTPFVVTAEPQPPVNTVYFAEGYTGTVAAGANADFVETLSILNANNYTTTYTVTYFLQNGISSVGVPNGTGISSTKVVTGTLAPNSVVERSVNTDVGLNQEVAAEVSSPSPLGAERVISRSKAGKALDSDSSLGQLLDLTSTASSFNYYFAGGEVMLTNEEYLSILNPTTTVASVTINILPQAVISATSVPTVAPLTVTVQGNSRITVPIRAYVEKSGNGQIKFGLSLTSNVPLAVEREEYFGDGIGSGKYGATAKPASSTLFRQYIFAADSGTFPSSGGNAAVGTGSDVSEVDIINPNPASAGSATVTVSFFDKSGHAINSQQVQVDGGTRETVNVNDVVGTQADVFSTVVTSDRNVYVERPTFYGGNPNNGGTFAAAEPSGSPAGLTSVEFPYLDITSPTGAVISQTVYLYNPGATTITVRGIYVSSVGNATVVKTYSVPANSIVAVDVNADTTVPTTGTGGLPAGARGAIFQIVNVGTNQPSPNNGESFIASVVGNAPSFSQVVGDQGTYPIGAATGY